MDSQLNISIIEDFFGISTFRKELFYQFGIVLTKRFANSLLKLLFLRFFQLKRPFFEGQLCEIKFLPANVFCVHSYGNFYGPQRSSVDPWRFTDSQFEKIGFD